LQDLHITSKGGDYKHTVIYGPPGTGKTEIARILGKMYSKIGVLQNNKFVKVTRQDLIAGYLGQTAIKTAKVIEEARGGVLFIDEAYSLASSEKEDSFSKECLDTLCESLSNYKNDLMVIIAGYEHELNNTFFRVNKGLDSRFIWRFSMDPYNPEELMEIYKKIVRLNEWSLKDEALSLEWFKKNSKCFVNYGRDMEQLFTYTKICHSRRIYGKSKDEKKKITDSDVEKALNMFMDNRKEQEEHKPYLYGLYV
jgi:SpoVK/Ycf46/Vps4 family AAA+-type ATPase